MQHFQLNDALTKQFVPKKCHTSSPAVADLNSELSTLRLQIQKAVHNQEQDCEASVAQVATLRAVKIWWHQITQGYDFFCALRDPWTQISAVRLGQQASRLLYYFGRRVAECSLPVAAYHIGMLYTDLLPRSYKRSQSLYYTPPALASKLVDMAIANGASFETDRVLEPSCGGGVVITTALIKMMESSGHLPAGTFLDTLPNRLTGYELDPFGAWLAQIMIDGVLFFVVSASSRKLPVLVLHRDALAPMHSNGYDLVIGNPPYGRVKLETRNRVRFSRSCSGHANLYKLFFDQAAQTISERGRICFITPTSFLSGIYSSRLRELLRTAVNPTQLSFLSDRCGVFQGVTQSVALSCFSAACTNNGVSVTCLDVGKEGHMQARPLGRYDLPDNLNSVWILPRTEGQVDVARSVLLLSSSLSAWGYNVHTGPVIWNRFKDRLSTDQTPSSVPMIWAEAVRLGPDGVPKLQWTADRKDDKRWFGLHDREASLTCTKPVILVQRTTSPDQVRRLIVADLSEHFLMEHGSVVIENHLNMIKASSSKPLVSRKTVLTFLSSSAADAVIRCISGSTAISATDLRTMPLPCPTELSTLDALVLENADRDLIEAECWRLVLQSTKK